MLIASHPAACTAPQKMRSLERSDLKQSKNARSGGTPFLTVNIPKAHANGHTNGHANGMVVGGRHPAKIQILVVDEHPLFREGAVNLINQQLDMVACGNADAIASVQNVLKGCKPDLVLLGLQLGTGDTLEFIKALNAQYCDLRILLFSH